MSDEYKDVFSGFLNQNTKKTSDKSPAYKSSAGKSAIVVKETIPAGTILYIAAWGGKSEHGNYINIKAQAKTEELKKSSKAESGGDDFNDDIPF